MMIHNGHKIKQEHTSSIFCFMRIALMVSCFYFCTALIDCTKHINGNAKLKKGRLPDKPSYDMGKQVGPTIDLDICLSLLEKALQGDGAAIDFLTKKGNTIALTTRYEPGLISMNIVHNGPGSISFILEYPRNKANEISRQQPATLIEGTPSVDANLLPPSYAAATNPPPAKAAIDLNCWNRWGETPLTEVIKNADRQNRMALLPLLLKAGANPNRANAKGQVPLEIVDEVTQKDDQEAVVGLLITYGANPLRASMDEAIQQCVRNVLIGHFEKVDLDAELATSSGALTTIDKKLQLFFYQKYNRADTTVSGQEDQTCVVCYKKEEKPTTIQIPSCDHYVHGSCLVRSLIHKSKGSIKWTFPPSYVYTHLCPCCQKKIAQAFIKDLNQFYSGIKFDPKFFNLAIKASLVAAYLIYLVPFLI